MKNAIGLDAAQSQALAAELNQLLSSYQILYMNVRGFHWNIRGNHFFELHLKFEEIYNDLLLKVDELAERILTLGAVPEHSFSRYLTLSSISEAQGIHEGRTCIESLLAGFRELLMAQRTILNRAAEAGDEGTSSLLSDYIQQQEKLVWMLRAYLD